MFSFHIPGFDVAPDKEQDENHSLVAPTPENVAATANPKPSDRDNIAGHDDPSGEYLWAQGPVPDSILKTLDEVKRQEAEAAAELESIPAPDGEKPPTPTPVPLVMPSARPSSATALEQIEQKVESIRRIAREKLDEWVPIAKDKLDTLRDNWQNGVYREMLAEKMAQARAKWEQLKPRLIEAWNEWSPRIRAFAILAWSKAQPILARLQQTAVSVLNRSQQRGQDKN